MYERIPNVTGTIDRHGDAVLKFNDCNGGRLLGPNGLKYLPCSDNCGGVFDVPVNVVSYTCDDCADAREPDDAPDESMDGDHASALESIGWGDNDLGPMGDE